MKVLKPSSIHASRRSSKPTIIGNQLWPSSCAVSQNSPLLLVAAPSKASPGYSIPLWSPPTLTATGHGNGYQRLEKFSIESLRYSVERAQPSGPAACGG